MLTNRAFVCSALVLGLFLGLAFTAVVVQAQEEQYLELIRQDLKTAKTAYMTEGMQLTAQQGEIFWPLYREYQADLAKIGDRRLANIKDYAEHFDNMTSEKASRIIKQSFKNRKAGIGLLEKYAKKVSKELDPVTAARFVQVENTLNLLIELQLAGEIPLFQHGAED